jgi:hypothetical protein
LNRAAARDKWYTSSIVEYEAVGPVIYRSCIAVMVWMTCIR